MSDPLSTAAKCLRSAQHVVVFTGAGISAESGIPTFRDEGGVWQRFPVDQFATWQGLLYSMTSQPQRLAEFLHDLLRPVAIATPNAGHRAIAAIERHTRVTVVTQNIDRLHQDAGSTRVHEVHGSLFHIATRDGRWLRELSRRQMLDIAGALADVMPQHTLARSASEGSNSVDPCSRLGPVSAAPSGLALRRLLRAIRPMAGVCRYGP